MKLGSVMFAVVAMMTLCGNVAAQGLLDIGLYDRETIYLYSDFSGDGYVKNGEIRPVGFLGSNLAKEMAGSEYALDEMAKARRHKIISMTSGAVVTAVEIASLIIYLRDRDYVSKPGFQITTISVGVIGGTLAMIFGRSATSGMNRAVWLYNRDVISRRR